MKTITKLARDLKPGDEIGTYEVTKVVPMVQVYYKGGSPTCYEQAHQFQVNVKPTWRLLDEGELIEEGDEFYFEEVWKPTDCIRLFDNGTAPYRRRIK
jgi:hypothetical protein